MNSVRNKPLNVGEVLRRYEKIDVASHLACLSRPRGRQVYDVISGATQRYIKLQHKDQLRLDLQLLPFNAPLACCGVLYLVRGLTLLTIILSLWQEKNVLVGNPAQ